MKLSKNRGFTIIELIVVVGIIGAIILLLLPVLGKARERADIVKCMNNMRQLSIAAQLYAGDHHGEVPDVAPDPSNPDACLANTDYIDDDSIYVCPNDTRSEDEFGDFKTSYTATLFTPANLFSSTSVLGTILYIESDKAGVETRDQIDLSDCTPRHGGITAIAYADGNVSSYQEENVALLAQGQEERAASRGRRLDPGEGKPDYAGTPRRSHDEEYVDDDDDDGGPEVVDNVGDTTTDEPDTAAVATGYPKPNKEAVTTQQGELGSTLTGSAGEEFSE